MKSLKEQAREWVEQNEKRYAPVYGGEYGLNHVPDYCVPIVASGVRLAMQDAYRAGLIAGRRSK